MALRAHEFARGMGCGGRVAVRRKCPLAHVRYGGVVLTRRSPAGPGTGWIGARWHRKKFAGRAFFLLTTEVGAHILIA